MARVARLPRPTIGNSDPYSLPFSLTHAQNLRPCMSATFYCENVSLYPNNQASTKNQKSIRENMKNKIATSQIFLNFRSASVRNHAGGGGKTSRLKISHNSQRRQAFIFSYFRGYIFHFMCSPCCVGMPKRFRHERSATYAVPSALTQKCPQACRASLWAKDKTCRTPPEVRESSRINLPVVVKAMFPVQPDP